MNKQAGEAQTDSAQTGSAQTGAARTGEGAMQDLERVLGHPFAQPELLTLALTHRSFVHDAKAARPEDLGDPGLDNEQLEFVGDAVLGLLAAEGLCRRFPASREGELTRLRASVVSRKYLGEVGTRLELGRWLRLGVTAEKNDGRRSAALFANAMEALIAALYLDGGLDAARHFVEMEVLEPAMPELHRSLTGEDGVGGAVGDHKSALEMLQADKLGRPEYRLVSESGPDHRRVFRVQVTVVREDGAAARIPAGALAEAEGSSKKQAQQEAARLAVAKLAASGVVPVNPRRKHG
jgi:ribonuclease-3